MTRRYVALLWLLSGLPVGLALIFLPPTARYVCFVLFVLLETGHSLSPIVLAWTHREFRRQVIYSQPGKFLALPSSLFLAALSIGVATQSGWTSYHPGPGASARITGWDNPLPLLVWFYSAWNLYHFAMQDFGVLMLWSGPSRRWVKRAGCVVGLVGIYFLVLGVNVLGFWRVPGFLNPWWAGLATTIMIGFVSVNHWIVDIGMSGRVARHGWVFVVSILSLGVIGFAWIIPTPNGTVIRMIPSIICARLGLGFVHFLYSRWVWQLSDPQVRATIGRDLAINRCAGPLQALRAIDGAKPLGVQPSSSRYEL